MRISSTSVQQMKNQLTECDAKCYIAGKFSVNFPWNLILRKANAVKV